MAQRKPVNPFYLALLPVGIVFAITACAYLVMTMRVLDPRRAADTALISLLARHGTIILVFELSFLGLLTVAAIASDDYWMRRLESTTEPKSDGEEAP